MNQLAVCALLGAAAFAQEPAPQAATTGSVRRPSDERGMQPPLPGPDFHRERRQALMGAVGEGVILVRGAGLIETYERFKQAHSFLYLTGVRDPDCELLLVPRTGEEILIVPPVNPMWDRWEGRGVEPGEKGQQQTGVARVVPGRSPALVRELKAALERCGDIKVVYCEFQPEEKGAASQDQLMRAQAQWRNDPFDGRRDRNHHLRESLGAVVPEATVENLSPLLNRLRTIKQPAEQELLGYAARLAALGIAEAMKACVPGQREYELAAVAEYAFKRHGAQGIGYMPIVGSGPNGCVLHHWRNDRVMRDGELVVMDFAPDVGGWVADVTRTFPVNGKFTDKQRKLVQDVWDAQQAILAAIRPGVSMGKLSQVGSRLLAERGYKPGVHILHGPCHHLGMAVHDVSAGGDRLEEGMYITVEPGAYLVEQDVGCRIEDCVLVTKDGCRVLSEGCPSRPEEKYGVASARLAQLKVGL
jgi:Xaa-Pro aminopeptidase